MHIIKYILYLLSDLIMLIMPTRPINNANKSTFDYFIETVEVDMSCKGSSLGI